jgi:hypothetical protein
MLAIDVNDAIVGCLAKSVNATPISTYKDLKNFNKDIPVIFRSMAQRKTVSECVKTNRDYFYIDTGYYGNLFKRKDWHRVVKNGMQHSNIRYDLPDNRFNFIINGQEFVRFNKWRKDGDNILIVTPSDKPCNFYGINRDEWLENTITELTKHTDRKIIIRNKGLRKDRTGDKSIYNQFEEDGIFAVVTYNSIAATEAIGYGIPCFTLAPNAADPFCLKDLSKIETPLYEDESKVIKWQHWLGHCQYTPEEMLNGTAMRLIEEYDLK